MEQRSWPGFFIAGAPKCGTTSLARYLAQHPEIFIPDFKEPKYFGADLQYNYSINDAEEYLSLFREADEDQLKGEATVWYLSSHTAPEEINKVNPDARIIIMLRHPTDMIFSLYKHRLYYYQEFINTFEKALLAETIRKKEGKYMPARIHVPHGLYYTKMGMYAEAVERYYDTFGKDQVHVVILEEFVRDKVRAFQQVLSFLGVEDTFEPDFVTHNESKEVKSYRLNRLLRNPSPELARFFRVMIPSAFLRRKLHNYMVELNKSKSEWQMSPVTKDYLDDYFREEVERMSRLLGRDLEVWKNRNKVKG